MGRKVHLILAINVDDEMDSRDDEDHEEFLRLKKTFCFHKTSFITYYKKIYEYFFGQLYQHFHKKVVHEQVEL
jgi:hypothetical protein